MKLNWKCQCHKCTSSREALSFLVPAMAGILLAAVIVFW